MTGPTGTPNCGGSAGESDPDAWAEAAAIWQRLGRPHRAAYASLRQAQALLARSRNPMTAAGALRAAAEAATGMAHVSNILRKLNVVNRAEAAAVGERAGLV